MRKVKWMPLHFPCLLCCMRAHGQTLRFALGLYPSRATWFESQFCFLSYLPWGKLFRSWNLNASILTITSRVLEVLTQDGTNEMFNVSMRRRLINAYFVFRHPSSRCQTASPCRWLTVFWIVTSSTENKVNDEDCYPWLWAYYGLGFCQALACMISFSFYKGILWRTHSYRQQHRVCAHVQASLQVLTPLLLYININTYKIYGWW